MDVDGCRRLLKSYSILPATAMPSVVLNTPAKLLSCKHRGAAPTVTTVASL